MPFCFFLSILSFNKPTILGLLLKNYYLAVTFFLLLSHQSIASGLVAVIQPKLTEQDYRTAETLQSSLEPYFQEIRAKRTSNEAVLAVLPEYIGTWLVASGEDERVFRAQNEERAMIWVILHHPFRFLKTLLGSLLCSDFHGSFMGHVRRSIFLMQATKMLQSYEKVFSNLAGTYQYWIVAGSILLPECEIIDGRIKFKERRRLLNQSFVFNPRGEAVLVTKKVYPLKEELEFMDSGEVSTLQIVETDLGRLGVLVCADSWYPDTYTALREVGVDIIAVPSFVTPGNLWKAPWKGYNPQENEPEDVDRGDMGRYLEKDMWEKYAVCGRVGISGAALGTNSFLVGSFWGMTGAGQSTIATPEGIVAKAPEAELGHVLYYAFTE